ncbi:uncharacterized protein EAF02_007377 [Botrytis sinoallii]|uniref:uncharacterized protein n=1 Tax=Botrytis sinoallii TaxID=1463999 RepID=UPI001902B115|nr:uncharacterized protein EAF02_007377 [Botrytis sinoallii]KAF7880531.1 hypothetical protein EAF02_007377 [Botrytis sinoallii]
MLDGNQNSDAPWVPIQYDAPSLGHKRMMEKLNQAIEPPPQIQRENRYQTTYQTSQPNWQYKMREETKKK